MEDATAALDDARSTTNRLLPCECHARRQVSCVEGWLAIAEKQAHAHLPGETQENEATTPLTSLLKFIVIT